MAITAIGLPLYWLNEPGRQSGAVENFDQTFINRGAQLFAPTADGGYNCAGCHGAEGVGGQAPPFTLTDANGEFVATVTWQRPGAQHRAAALQRGGAPPDPRSTAAPAPRCRRGAPRAVARSPPSRSTSSSPTSARSSSPPTRPRRRSRQPCARSSASAEGDDDRLHRPRGRRGALQPRHRDRARRAAPTPALAATPRVPRSCTAPSSPPTPTSATTPASPTAPVPSASRSPAAWFPASSSPRRRSSSSSTTAPSTAMLYGQRGQGSGRMPGFGDNPNTARRRPTTACSPPEHARGRRRATRPASGATTGGTGVPAPAETTTTTTTEGP